MKKESHNIDVTKVYDIITDGLIDENKYYHCEISSDWSVDDGSLIEELSNALWVNAVDEPISKNEKRGISYLAKLQSSTDYSQAVFVGICDCCFSRRKETKVEIDTNFPEKDIKDKDVPPQMSSQAFTSFYKSALEGGKDTITMQPLIVKCKTLPQVPKCDECEGRGLVSCDYCHGFGKGDCPDCNGFGELFPEGEFGKSYRFRNKIGYVIKEVLVPSMSFCHACNGTGKFSCDVCGGSGEIKCKSCGGSGIRNNGNTAQKVTRMVETYSIAKRCFLSLPNENVIDVDTNMQKIYLLNQPLTLSTNQHHRIILLRI